MIPPRFSSPIPFSKTLIVALAGFVLTAYFLTHQTLSQPEPAPIRPPAVRPFNNAVAGTGIVEPTHEAVAVSPNFSGKVTRVFVRSPADHSKSPGRCNTRTVTGIRSKSSKITARTAF